MILVIDTETTGVHEGDEIIQLSIIDGDGNELWNRYYKPEHHTEWPGAQNVNGISPEFVADKPPISADHDAIQWVIDQAEIIVGYNTQFDIARLREAGFEISERTQLVDVMLEFAPIYGEWNEKYGEYKWQKLTKCAEYYGYKYHAHDSLEDVRATLFCWKKIQQGQSQ